MIQRSPRVEVLLSCEHMQFFPSPFPNKGDQVLCLRCNDYRIVRTDQANQFRYKCDGCNVGRKFGEDESNANRSASGHALRSGHTVSVYKGKTKLRTIGSQGEHLPFELEVQERATFVRSHQQSLRRMTTVTKPLP